MPALVAIRERLKRGVHPNPVTGCWMWALALSKDGYGRISYKGKNRDAHRVSYEIYNGPIDGKSVCHACDVRSCINPDHLFLGTHAENIADRDAKGRGKWLPRFGENNHRSKLNIERVAEIRSLFASGVTTQELAEKFAVSVSTIGRVVKNQYWNQTGEF